MKLEGIHHITAITADAQGNVDFYAGVLGLRLVKKSVNQDHTSVYHLFYADETGDPGSDLTFFEYPGLPRGRAGAGMVHRIVWRVSGTEALDFWQQRLTDAGYDTVRGEDHLRFEDFEGLDARAAGGADRRSAADRQPPGDTRGAGAPGIPRGTRLRADPPASDPLLEETLGFRRRRANGSLRGPRRASRRLLSLRPAARAAAATGRRQRAPRRVGLAAR